MAANEAAFRYELAKLRLQFLTAVPSLHRAQQANWPHAYLFAASRGLSLTSHAEQLLRTVATTLVFGDHDPLPAIHALSNQLEAEHWEELLSDLVVLNAHHKAEIRCLAEMVTRVTGHVSALPLLAPLPPPPPPEPQQPPEPQPVRSEPPQPAREPPTWHDAFDDLGVKAVLIHLEKFGAISEPEATKMLGSPYAYRKFSRELDEHMRKAPFRVVSKPSSEGKRYEKVGGD